MSAGQNPVAVQFGLAYAATIAVVLLLAITLVLDPTLPLGGSGDSSPHDPVTETVSAYVDALVRGEGKVACDLMTRNARRGVLMGARRKYPELKTRSCADAYSKASIEPEILGPFYKELLLATPPTVLELGDRKATAVQFRLGLSTLFRLIKSGDRWLISEGLDLWRVWERQERGS